MPFDTGLMTRSRLRYAGLGGRGRGERFADGRPIVFLHGLTFDRRMWDPILDALPPEQRAIAFDLPGHGSSPALARHDLESVADAVHEAVLAAGLDRPLMVGHSIGAPIASIYASKYPASGVVNVDSPVRVEPLAQMVQSIAPQLQERLRHGLVDDLPAEHAHRARAGGLPPPAARGGRRRPAARARLLVGPAPAERGRPRGVRRDDDAPAGRHGRAVPRRRRASRSRRRIRRGSSSGCRGPSSRSGPSGITSPSSSGPRASPRSCWRSRRRFLSKLGRECGPRRRIHGASSRSRRSRSSASRSSTRGCRR